jgi:creatinine amidohydrolase
MRSDLYSGGGESFPGTCSIRPETFLMLCTDILEELYLDGFRRFVLLNAHYENAALLREASRRLTKKYDETKILFSNWWDIPSRSKILDYFPENFPGMDLEHAGLLETSLMLYCFPELVKDKGIFPHEITVPPGFELYPEKLNDITGGLGALAPATNASAAIGKEIFQMVVEGLSDHINSKLRD